MAKDDLRKLQEQVERDKAAANGEPVPEPVDDDDNDNAATQAEIAALGEETAAAPVPTSPRGGISLRFGSMRLPVVLGLGAAWAGHRIFSSGQQLLAHISEECETLKGMTRSRSDIEAPSGPKREALEELRRRKELLSTNILPLLAQLEQPADAQSLGKPLGARSSDELEELRGTLSARVEACGALLAQYDAIGQSPPSGFRAWPLARLEEHLAHFNAKGDELRAVAQLLSRLGSPRVDGDLPEWDAAALKAYATTLEEQVVELEARKEKEELLGKIEAELWRRKEEAPVALATLSTKKLRKLYKHLKTGGDAAAVDV